MPAVPIGAAGEKFLKFDAFLCIFKAFFRFPSPVRGGNVPPFPPSLRHWAKELIFTQNSQFFHTCGAYWLRRQIFSFKFRKLWTKKFFISSKKSTNFSCAPTEPWKGIILAPFCFSPPGNFIGCPWFSLIFYFVSSSGRFNWLTGQF